MSTYVHCYLSPPTAIRLASPDAGSHAVAMTGEALSSLTAEERERLSRYASSNRERAPGERLDLMALPTAEGVVESLRAWMAAKVAEENVRQAARESRIQRALASPLADWISARGKRRYIVGGGSCGEYRSEPLLATYPQGFYLSEDELTDPRIVERRAQAEREVLPAAREEWEARYREWESSEAERKETERVEAARAEAEQKASRARKLAEATAWIADRGSPRLRKAVAAGLLSSSLAVYRDERLATEHPGWEWTNARDFRDLRGPSEEALDALVEARTWEPTAELRWAVDQGPGAGEYTGPVVVASFLDSEIALRVGENEKVDEEEE